MWGKAHCIGQQCSWLPVNMHIYTSWEISRTQWTQNCSKKSILHKFAASRLFRTEHICCRLGKGLWRHHTTACRCPPNRCVPRNTNPMHVRDYFGELWSVPWIRLLRQHSLQQVTSNLVPPVNCACMYRLQWILKALGREANALNVHQRWNSGASGLSHEIQADTQTNKLSCIVCITHLMTLEFQHMKGQEMVCELTASRNNRQDSWFYMMQRQTNGMSSALQMKFKDWRGCFNMQPAT